MKKTGIKILIFFFMIAVTIPMHSNVTATAEAGMGNLYDRRQQPVFRVAFDPEMPPFQNERNENGEYDGFSVDLLKHIAQRNSFLIRWVPMSTEEAARQLKENRVDMILGIAYQARYAQQMEFTEPFFSSSIALVVPRSEADDIENIADLSEKLVAVQRDSVAYEFLQNVRRIDFNGATSQKKAFYLLIMGRADALVGDRLVLQHYLEEKNLTEHYVVTSSFIMPVEYTMAVKSENYATLNLLNRGIQLARGQSDYQRLYDEWFAGEDIQQRLEVLLRAFAILSGIAVLVFLVILWWNRVLKKEVQKKTDELKTANDDLSRQIQETLNMSELKNQVLQNSPRGLVTVDQDGILTSFNPRAGEITGIEENITGHHHSEVDLLKLLLTERIENVLEKGTQYVGGEMAWNPPDRKKMFIRYTIYPLRSYEKVIVGTIASFEDITEEKRLRDQGIEKEKNKALNQVVAGIAHEIRNPLTSIKTFVELLPVKMNNPKFQQDMSRYVPKEIDRVSKLIESLIDYAKPKKNNRQQIDLKGVINSVAVLFAPSFERKAMDLVVDVEEALWVYADRDQLKQVLVNFMLNGMEAMEEKQNENPTANNLTMTILGRKKGDTAEILIQDEGIGLTQSEITKMLDPFYTTKKGGTGLGLTLSKRYIEENEGQVYFESVKGQGTIVHLQFERVNSYETNTGIG